MSAEVPSSSPALELQISSGPGWRGQESWGRWTLGKTSTLQVQSLKQQWVSLNLQLQVPYQEQRAQIKLEGQALWQVTAPKPAATYQLHLLALLPAGQHSVTLETDRSNRSGPQAPFAPLDQSDLGLGVSQFSFEPAPVFQNDRRELYGTLPGNTYQAVPAGKVTALLKGGSNKQVHFTAISPTAQHLSVKLDGETIRTFAMKAGLLLDARVDLPLSPAGLHRLDLQSGPPLSKTVSGSMQTLENELGSAPLYLQNLQVNPVNPVVEGGQLPAAALLAGLLLWGLYRWLSPDREIGRSTRE